MTKVEVIQYVHPNGRPRPTYVELPDEVAKMAEYQVLTCECIPFNYNKIIFYSYLWGTDPNKDSTCEHNMIADNGPGENSPANILEKLIREMDKIRTEGK
jgi:hypothetical protein